MVTRGICKGWNDDKQRYKESGDGKQRKQGGGDVKDVENSEKEKQMGNFILF